MPYVFGQGVLTLDSTAVPFDSFALSIDNRISVRMRNSLTPTCFLPTGRRVALNSTHTIAYDAWDAGIAGSLVFTAGAYSLTATFPQLRNIYQPPTVPGKTEIPLELSFEALSTVATGYEIRFTNDSTT